jgi:predicted nucleotidyltransferase component of viral defense system
MDKAYADTVRLLLTVAPDVFRNAAFAMKGGTAINMFVRDMPRLSVDIDVVYTPWNVTRDEALGAITGELAAIRERLEDMGLVVHTVGDAETGDRTLLVSSGVSVVKVEVNVVFRGTVLPVQKRPLVTIAADTFAAELELPILAIDELYGSKLVAAMDRQHPRDLFDVWEMEKAGGISDQTVECFVVYLAGHNRPTHEVLFGRQKDISLDYRTTFVGMATEDVALATLLETRVRLFEELPKRLTVDQGRFLIGLARAEPDWSLLTCPHAAKLPALQWKLFNLQKLRTTKPGKLDEQAKALQQWLE